MELLKIEDMFDVAYGIDISKSKNVKLVEQIFESALYQLSDGIIDDYQYFIKKETVGDVLPWFVDNIISFEETVYNFFKNNKELNPYNIQIDCWDNKLFYSQAYPWERPEEHHITYAQVEETFKLIAKAFAVEE